MLRGKMSLVVGRGVAVPVILVPLRYVMLSMLTPMTSAVAVLATVDSAHTEAQQWPHPAMPRNGATSSVASHSWLGRRP